MYGLGSISPALPPLIGCLVALSSLYVGWTTVRAGATPPLLKPMVRLNAILTEAIQGKEAVPTRSRLPSPAELNRVYGYAWMYAGGLGLVIAGIRLVRLIIGS